MGKRVPKVPRGSDAGRDGAVALQHVLYGDGSTADRVVSFCRSCGRTLSGRGALIECSHHPLAHARSPARGDLRRDAASTPLSALMNREVVCVQEDVSLEALTELFAARGLAGAPVLDAQGALVGFVSLADLVRQRQQEGETEERWTQRPGVADREDLATGFQIAELTRATVRDLMTPVVVTLEETAPLTLAAALMAFEGLDCIPVLSAQKALVGLVSALDVARWLAQQDGYEIPRGRRWSLGPGEVSHERPI